MITAETFNALIDYILENQIVEIIGTQERKTPKGRVVSLPKIAVAGTSSSPAAGDPKVLSSVQGTRDTDTYDNSVDAERLVQLALPTDFQYDEASLTLSYRTRTIVVPAASVSEESEGLITIAVAEICEDPV
jgi:hypothetical protein